MRPVGDHIVVRTGFVGRGDNDACTGTIVAVGPECEYHFVAGMRIAFRKWTGAELEVRKERLLVMCEKEVLAVLDEDEIS